MLYGHKRDYQTLLQWQKRFTKVAKDPIVIVRRTVIRKIANVQWLLSTVVAFDCLQMQKVPIN